MIFCRLHLNTDECCKQGQLCDNCYFVFLFINRIFMFNIVSHVLNLKDFPDAFCVSIYAKIKITFCRKVDIYLL